MHLLPRMADSGAPQLGHAMARREGEVGDAYAVADRTVLVVDVAEADGDLPASALGEGGAAGGEQLSEGGSEHHDTSPALRARSAST